MSEKRTEHLFDGILQSAQKESDTILANYKKEAEQLEATYVKKIEQAVQAETKATENRLAQIQRAEESTIRNLQRRHDVSYSQRLRLLVLDLVAKKMENLVDSKRYKEVLIGWIAEAAIGLDQSEAIVNYSFKESVDQTMLDEATKLIKKAIGKDVKLHLGTNSLTSLGIEVTSLDKKVAYNNQVATRLIRHERDLKELMEGHTCRKG
jgi:vacuolar-type H+-ATPase subunit E/Vma4